MAFYATRLGIDASSQTLLKEADPDLKAWQEMSKHYTLNDFLVIAYSPKSDLLSNESLNTIAQISDELSKIDGTKGVTSILTVPLLKSVKGGVSGLLNGIKSLKDKDINKQQARLELENSPIYTNNIVSKDLKTTAIILNLKPNLSRQEQANLISNVRAVLANFNPQDKLYLGGASMIANDMIEFISRDLKVYAIALSVLLAICLWLFFKRIRWVWLAIFICTASVIFSAGAFAMAGWQITAVSSNFIAIELIITISIIIHLICTYNEISRLHPSLSAKALTYLTLQKKASPSFWAIFTTVVGFASLCISDIKPVMMLGVMMSLSVAMSLVLSFLLFGAICALLPTLKARTSSGLSLQNFTQKASSIAIKSPTFIFMICFFTLAFSAWGISQLRAENSFISYFSKDTEISKGMLIIDNDLGGTIPLDVVVKFKQDSKNTSQSENEFEDEFSDNDDKYWFNAKRVRVAKEVHEYLAFNKFIGSVLSLNTIVNIIIELEGKASGFILAAMKENMPQNYAKILLDPYVNIDKGELRFSVRVKDSDPSLRRNEFIKNLKLGLDEIAQKENVKIEVLGAMILYNNVLQSLVKSQLETILITILALFVLFIFVFKSLKIAIIAIISNLIPLVLVFGIMGALDIPLDVMSITIAAIAYGIGVDDIIHYIHRYLSERASHDIKTSIKRASKGIGSAMFYTSAAIFVGFGVMMSSEFVPTVYFGGLICLVMVVMLVSALTLLPAMLYKFKA
ncbi:membrane protein [Campylobacter sp. 19-13652]|nr:membrane protein [Campylobacter sp. 19-13652]